MLKLTRLSPAFRRAAACDPKSAPLVVMARSRTPGIAESDPTSRSTPWRKSGSPPVTRTFSIPKSTAIRTTRVISSKLRISDFGFHSR